MNRLNTEISIARAVAAEPTEQFWEEETRPLYTGNLIYLPFARHLAEDDEAEYNKAA